MKSIVKAFFDKTIKLIIIKFYYYFLNEGQYKYIKKFGRENNLMKNTGNIEQLESTKNMESYIERDIKNAKEILERMNPNQKINYHTILTKLITDWKNKDIRPKILIHR